MIPELSASFTAAHMNECAHRCRSHSSLPDIHFICNPCFYYQSTVMHRKIYDLIRFFAFRAALRHESFNRGRIKVVDWIAREVWLVFIARRSIVDQCTGRLHSSPKKKLSLRWNQLMALCSEDFNTNKESAVRRVCYSSWRFASDDNKQKRFSSSKVWLHAAVHVFSLTWFSPASCNQSHSQPEFAVCSAFCSSTLVILKFRALSNLLIHRTKYKKYISRRPQFVVSFFFVSRSRGDYRRCRSCVIRYILESRRLRLR